MPNPLLRKAREQTAPLTLESVIGNALLQWAQERQSDNLSRDVAHAPVRTEAATRAATAVRGWQEDATP